MDMSVRVDRIDPALLIGMDIVARPSSETRERFLRARDYARARGHGEVRRHLDARARALLESAARRSSLSGRAVTRMLRVARTIADLAGEPTIGEEHVAEALGYRAWEAQ